jgi:hypothetical protein
MRTLPFVSDVVSLIVAPDLEEYDPYADYWPSHASGDTVAMSGR